MCLQTICISFILAGVASVRWFAYTREACSDANEMQIHISMITIVNNIISFVAAAAAVALIVTRLSAHVSQFVPK